jgi:hypothetical protein
MAKVILHIHNPNSRTDEWVKVEWLNLERNVSRVPSVGEYVVLSQSSEWHRVYAVVHYAFDCEIEADVYIIKTDRHPAIMGFRPQDW